MTRLGVEVQREVKSVPTIDDIGPYKLVTEQDIFAESVHFTEDSLTVLLRESFFQAGPPQHKNGRVIG